MYTHMHNLSKRADICRESVDYLISRFASHSLNSRASSSLTINPVHQLNTTNLALPKLVQPIKHTLQSSGTGLDRVHSELLASDKLRSQVPERLRELEVLWLCGHVHAAGPLESFAGEGVAESGLRNSLVCC